MIKVQNIQSGEVINVLNVVVENGQIISEARRPHKGSRFYSSYPMMLSAGISEDDRDLHVLADGWTLATKGERKERKPRQPKQEMLRPDRTRAELLCRLFNICRHKLMPASARLIRL